MSSFRFILGCLNPPNVLAFDRVQFRKPDWLNWGAVPLLGAATADVLHRPILSTEVWGDLLNHKITKKKKKHITAMNHKPLNNPMHTRTHAHPCWVFAISCWRLELSWTPAHTRSRRCHIDNPQPDRTRTHGGLGSSFCSLVVNKTKTNRGEKLSLRSYRVMDSQRVAHGGKYGASFWFHL